MGGTEGQLAQVSPCLVPTFMVNTQHQVKHRPAGKPSYGNRHCRSKYFNYGSQTGRGLDLTSGYGLGFEAAEFLSIVASKQAQQSETPYKSCAEKLCDRPRRRPVRPRPTQEKP